ncbi:hypothetical protein FE236_03135 [Mariprofundus erugo]|uniref:hypothetical protein n=1 Tax=Mariprofundus erugo TaxID=2528639 RepID=UPI0010FD5A02|nr:hypothetical protein [Mariprofundus erugo]TLS77613.1 hypothetical protein FE236_03135 [Mariprofundus erugo]
MISPDYFSFRWSWYRPILNRMEQPSARCKIEVRELPIRIVGPDAAEYIPYVVHSTVAHNISTALNRLQEYTIRYMVRGEKVSAHKLPPMDEKTRAMVSYLRSQNPHLSRDLLHHWCADPAGAPALLGVCEVLWTQGWKQDQADAAPWVPAVNILLLKLIRNEIATLTDEHSDITSHVMLHMTGALYIWALQGFLKRYLEGAVEVRRIASYESMMIPATPMVFMQYQPDSSLLADDSKVIRAYGLEPEIVPRMRQLRAQVGMRNEGGILQLLAQDTLGSHLQRRTWARLSLWKLAMDSQQGGWMRYVLNAKRLDQLLAGQIQPEPPLLENLKAHADVPVAAWLLACISGGRDAKNAGEPWLHDNITLMAFRVFDEDVNIETARRQAEKIWLERKEGGSKSGPAPLQIAGLRRTGGVRSVEGRQSDVDPNLTKAWQDGEFVYIQPDITHALHSGKKVAIRHASLRIEWSEYLSHMQALNTAGMDAFLTATLLPGVMSLLVEREEILLDECSASGCLLRGPVTLLTEAGCTLRKRLQQWFSDAAGEADHISLRSEMPPVSICMAMGGEWSFAEIRQPRSGDTRRIASAPSVAQAGAGACRNQAVAQLAAAQDSKLGLSQLGRIRIEALRTASGEIVRLLDNSGFAITAPAVIELTRALTGKASVREVRLEGAQLKGVLDEFRLPPLPMELLHIRRHNHEDQPWLLIKTGTVHLAGTDVALFEMMDEHNKAIRLLFERGLIR